MHFKNYKNTTEITQLYFIPLTWVEVLLDKFTEAHDTARFLGLELEKNKDVKYEVLLAKFSSLISIRNVLPWIYM